MSDDGENKIRDAQIREFLSKAFWLCENSPDICRRSQICQWLIYCLGKSGDRGKTRRDKCAAVNRLLDFFELRQREPFERTLIDFVRKFSQRASRRLRECSTHIENGTDWGRTYQKSLVESPGRLCAFVNYSRKQELDYATRNSLLLLAWDMGKELLNFAGLVDEFDSNTAGNFRERARNLMALRTDAEHLSQHYYSERTEYALRRTREGGRLADNIARWVFHPESNFRKQERQTDEKEFETAAQMLTKDLVRQNDINVNDLFEVVAIVTSIQVLTKMDFRIVECGIDAAKPMVKLQRNHICCTVQKNFFDTKKADDKLKHFRTVGNNPSGFQPDIVYGFRHDDGNYVYLLGDAKNYRTKTNRINYPVALFAMMHYLIAYREELKLGNTFDWLDGNPPPNQYQRTALFFPEDSKNDDVRDTSSPDDKSKRHPQPGEQGKWHPTLFVYGTKADATPLKQFFEDAISCLNQKRS